MPPKAKLESEFRTQFIEELEDAFPGCAIIFNDPVLWQGIPDILMLYKDRWAMFETKRAFGSSRQPNQDYYVEYFNEMSYASFVEPNNMHEVIDEVQRSFQTKRRSRISFGQ